MTSSITLPRVVVLIALLAVSGCSSGTSTSAAPSTPSTPSTPGGGGTITAQSCSYSLSSTKLTVAPVGGPSSIKVTTGTGCTWTATPSASFITVSSGSGVGGGNDTFVVNVAQAPGADRAGTVTVGGQTITVNQTGAGLNPDFNMRDPGSQTGITNVCRLRGGSSNSPTTCTFGNLSWSTTSSVISNWAWTVQYTYDGQTKTTTQSSGTIQDFQLREVCGLQGSTPTGATIPMTVTLTVTDQNGVTATGTSGQGIIPAMSLAAYTCGS